MGSGQHLDGFGQIAVAGDAPVVMAVGAGQLGQGRRVARIGLRPRGHVPFPIAGHRHRVHG